MLLINSNHNVGCEFVIMLVGWVWCVCEGGGGVGGGGVYFIN